MNIANFIINFLAFVGVITAILLLKSYLPKYAEAKATNQATKEDIGEITEIVETIKAELTKSTEELKAHLSLASQNRLNIKKAEQDALFDFNRKLTAWIYYIVRFPLLSFNETNYRELDDFQVEESRRRYELDLAEGHLELFHRDAEFYQTKLDLTKAVINLGSDLKGIILGLKSRFVTYDYELKQNGLSFDKFKEFSSERLQYLQDQRESFNELFKEVAKLHGELGRMLFDRINKIEREIEKD